MRRTLIFGLMLMAFVVSSCRGLSIKIEAPAEEEIATAGQSQTTDIESTQELETNKPAIRLTSTPSLTDTPPTTETSSDQTLTYCNTGILYRDDGPQQLPQPENLYWEVDQSAFGPIQKLMGATTAIYRVQPTPHDRWLMVEFVQTGLDNWVEVALYLVDLLGTDHWFVSDEISFQTSPYAWLEDGRLLWVDEGKLSIAEADGINKTTLTAPAPIDEVWLGAEYIAIARSEGRLWRVDVRSDTWQEVIGIPPSRNLAIVNNGIAALSVSVVQDYAIAEYWYIPLAFGSSPHLAASGKFWGGGGARTPAASQFAKSPYWTTAYVEQEVLIDERDGRLVTGEDVLPNIIESDDYVQTSSSPDGQWAIMDIWEKGTYIAPMQDLQSIQAINAEILAWQSDPPSVTLYQSKTLTNGNTLGSIRKLDLRTNEETILVDWFDNSGVEDVILVKDHFFLKHSIYSESGLQTYVDLMTIAGNPIGRLDLPVTNGWESLRLLEPARLMYRMTLVNLDAVDQCKYMDTIWIWDAALEGH